VREVLDRLREAETALDRHMHDLYFSKHTADRIRALELIWKGKKNLWYAQMHLVNAFAGARGPDPT